MKISEMEVNYRYHSGNDLDVVNAARTSLDKESEWVIEDLYTVGCWSWYRTLSDKDIKLINYLAKHNHWTPFAHTSVTLHIRAPIFVARQAGKHQVGLVWNEVSRRYVDAEPEFWFPKEWRGRPVNIKQGSDGVVDSINFHHANPERAVGYALDSYNAMLAAGVAPEMARMVLPQNMMTEWIWTGSLAAFARVCKLRLDPHSQKEIQELAGAIAAIVGPLYPISWDALMKDTGEIKS